MLDYIATKNLEIDAKHHTHFFEKGAKRFFNSRIGQLAYVVCDADGSKHAYFTTSERFDDSTPRKFTVRVMHMTPGASHWPVNKIGEFQAYANGKSAQAAMVKVAEAHNAASGATDNESFYNAHVALRDSNRNAEASNV